MLSTWHFIIVGLVILLLFGDKIFNKILNSYKNVKTKIDELDKEDKQIKK